MKDSLGSESLSDGIQGSGGAHRKQPATYVLAQELPRGRERVLVVDDNRVLAETTRRLLVDLGYDAVACDDPLRAVRLCTDGSRDTFDLLLTDYAMPQMNGYQLAHTLRQRVPMLRVLLYSAWSEDVIRENH